MHLTHTLGVLERLLFLELTFFTFCNNNNYIITNNYLSCIFLETILFCLFKTIFHFFLSLLSVLRYLKLIFQT